MKLVIVFVLIVLSTGLVVCGWYRADSAKTQRTTAHYHHVYGSKRTDSGLQMP
jgi:hypothetical protein